MKDNVKILISYHKPDFLIKNDVFIPIHGGRALAAKVSKDGIMSNEDYIFMINNMIGDDVGENISLLNRYFGEITTIYWAWKNYEKLKNPDYIGFMHYRRIFDFSLKSEKFTRNSSYVNKINKILNSYEIPSFNKEKINKYCNKEYIYKLLEKNDLIIPKHANLNSYEGYISYIASNITDNDYFKNMNIKDYLRCMLLIEENFPEISNVAKEYNRLNKSYYWNMFVMRKEEFFIYADFLFTILFNLKSMVGVRDARFLAGTAERLTGIFLYYLQYKKKLKFAEVPVFFVKNTNIVKELYPKNKDSICIVFSASESKIKLLSVSVISLMENSNINSRYEIYIINNNVSMINKNKILCMQTKNVFIEFVDINLYIGDLDIIDMYDYYMFYIPKIFKNYNKIIYLDLHTIVIDDIGELYEFDFQDKMICACFDIPSRKQVAIENDKCGFFTDYLLNTIGMTDPYDYFNTGVLILNIKKLMDFNFESKCLDKLNYMSEVRYMERDILNAVCEGEINYIDLSWNVESSFYLDNKYINLLPSDIYNIFINAFKHPKIVYYAKNDYSNVYGFWEYARISPFYEDIIYKGMEDIKNNIDSDIRKLNYNISSDIKRLDRKINDNYKVLEYNIKSIVNSALWWIPFPRLRENFRRKLHINNKMSFDNKLGPYNTNCLVVSYENIPSSFNVNDYISYNLNINNYDVINMIKLSNDNIYTTGNDPFIIYKNDDNINIYGIDLFFEYVSYFGIYQIFYKKEREDFIESNRLDYYVDKQTHRYFIDLSLYPLEQVSHIRFDFGYLPDKNIKLFKAIFYHK